MPALMRMAAVAALALCITAAPRSALAQAAPESREPCDAAPDSAAAGRVAAYLEPLAAAGQLSGTVLIARGACVVFERSYGMASFERGVPNVPETLFAVASVTKPLTEIVAERLAARGVVRMSDPLARWLPYFPRGGEITLDHLRRHRSGLPHRVTTPADEFQPHTAEEMARLASRAPLASAPGERFLYTSAGYSVLARVLEVAAGQPYATLLRETVLDPAGAAHSVDATEPDAGRPRADSYLGEADGPAPAPRRDLSFLVGGGSAWSTPRDLFRIVRALLHGAYGAETKAALVRWGPSEALNRGDGISWGGLIDGYRAYVSHDAATGLTVIFTTNLMTGAVGWLQSDLRKVVEGREIPPRAVPRIRPVALSPDVRARYEGGYEIGPGQTEALRFTAPARAEIGTLVLVPTGEGTFISPHYYTTVRAVTAADGSVEALEWSLDGAGGRWNRVR